MKLRSIINLTALLSFLLTLNPWEAIARISTTNKNPIGFDRLIQVAEHNERIIRLLKPSDSSSCQSITGARPYYVKVFFDDGYVQFILPVELKANKCAMYRDGVSRDCELKFIATNRLLSFNNKVVEKRVIHVPAPSNPMKWKNGGKEYILAKQPFELPSNGISKYTPCKLKDITVNVSY